MEPFRVEVDRTATALVDGDKEFKKKMQREEISQYMSSNDDAGDSAYTLGSVINKNA